MKAMKVMKSMKAKKADDEEMPAMKAMRVCESTSKWYTRARSLERVRTDSEVASSIMRKGGLLGPL